METTKVTCSECGHQADLYQKGNRYAGIWECDYCSASGECAHVDTHKEISIRDFFNPSRLYGHDQEEYSVTVCDACKCTVQDQFSPFIRRAA